MEVVFEYPDLSTVGVTDEATLNDECKGSQGGYAHQGIFGPFGLFVLTDENFQEQTALFFYIGCSSNGQWTVRFCNDQSRYDKGLKKDTAHYLSSSQCSDSYRQMHCESRPRN